MQNRFQQFSVFQIGSVWICENGDVILRVQSIYCVYTGYTYIYILKCNFKAELLTFFSVP